MTEPIQTDGIVEALLDPCGYFDALLSEPVMHVMELWAGRLAPVMSPADFMFSYYNVLADIRAGVIQSPLTRAGPEVHNLLFVMFPTMLPTLLGPRADEVRELWRRTMDEVRGPLPV